MVSFMIITEETLTRTFEHHFPLRSKGTVLLIHDDIEKFCAYLITSVLVYGYAFGLLHLYVEIATSLLFTAFSGQITKVHIATK